MGEDDPEWETMEELALSSKLEQCFLCLKMKAGEDRCKGRKVGRFDGW